MQIPAHLGYGDSGAPPTIPGGATLVFETVGVHCEDLLRHVLLGICQCLPAVGRCMLAAVTQGTAPIKGQYIACVTGSCTSRAPTLGVPRSAHVWAPAPAAATLAHVQELVKIK
jgi:hypothetical protein